MTEPTPSARLLDLSRLVSRSGRGLTGVDRVELAFAQALSADPVPLWGLVKTSLGYLLLDRQGVVAITKAATTDSWGQPDLLSRLSYRLDHRRQAGQSLARSLAVGRSTGLRLPTLLQRGLPAGMAYLNVGHSNITDRMFRAIRTVPGSRITVMIHDTIPLDLPDMQRAGTVEQFAVKLDRVARHADLVICPSQVSRADVLRHIGPEARPKVLAFHLGHTPVQPDPADLPAGLDLQTPYFVALGTIEPRKNHALLLDAWDAMGLQRPNLYFCGRRGWRNDEVFARLDKGINGVVELPGLSDAGVAALLQGAQALVFPSLSEGFGLPLIEAAALGVPVICGDLAICHEVLGQHAVYLSPTDCYQWIKKIEAMALRPRASIAGPAFDPPKWDDHFKAVLSVT